MRITMALMVLTFLATLVFAKGDEKVDVEAANVGPADVDVTLIATPDHHFTIGDKLLDASDLKAYIAEQQKDHPVKYVMVSGEEMTIGDLATVSHIGQALSFTVLFESKGQLK